MKIKLDCEIETYFILVDEGLLIINSRISYFFCVCYIFINVYEINEKYMSYICFYWRLLRGVD